MTYKIRLHPDAIKFLINLNSETKERLKSGMKSLETDPFKSRSGSNVKKLKGTKKREDLYRLRARVSLRDHRKISDFLGVAM